MQPLAHHVAKCSSVTRLEGYKRVKVMHIFLLSHIKLPISVGLYIVFIAHLYATACRKQYCFYHLRLSVHHVVVMYLNDCTQAYRQTFWTIR